MAHRPIIVVDLDNTLIYCTQYCNEPWCDCEPLTLSYVTVRLHRRPYCNTFLRWCEKKDFGVIVYSAASPEYVKAITNILFVRGMRSPLAILDRRHVVFTDAASGFVNSASCPAPFGAVSKEPVIHEGGNIAPAEGNLLAFALPEKGRLTSAHTEEAKSLPLPILNPFWVDFDRPYTKSLDKVAQLTGYNPARMIAIDDLRQNFTGESDRVFWIEPWYGNKYDTALYDFCAYTDSRMAQAGIQ